MYNKIQERKKWRESIMRKNNRHSNTHSQIQMAQRHIIG